MRANDRCFHAANTVALTSFPHDGVVPVVNTYTGYTYDIQTTATNSDFSESLACDKTYDYTYSISETSGALSA